MLLKNRRTLAWVLLLMVCIVATAAFQSAQFRTSKFLVRPSATLSPLYQTRLYTSIQVDSEMSPFPTPTTSIEQNFAMSKEKQRQLYRSLDIDIIKVALPAFVSLAADPIASIVDAMYVGRLGAIEQAAMGISISAQYSIAKLYNDPLLKTSTSLVAGKEGADLEASVATALVTAMIIGFLQMALFLLAGGPILSLMGVSLGNDMRKPALHYLWWRALGIPAATVLLVVNGIFRGRGDTRTPLYCTLLGTILNIVLDPILIFTMGMGCAGAGAATAVAQWVSAVPLVWLLHRRIVPLKLLGRDKRFYANALQAYIQAGLLLTFRTVAKIAAYAATSAAAARLGTVTMAAYSLTFNLGFATSQLCESISIAAQAILAREYPYQENTKKTLAATHVIKRALLLGFTVSTALAMVTVWKQDSVLARLTSVPAVFQTAKQVMPIVLATQLLKGLAYSTGGILLGGLDWWYSSMSMIVAATMCVFTLLMAPRISPFSSSPATAVAATSSWLTNNGRLTLGHIWQALAMFMAGQVLVAVIRIFSNTGPWSRLPLFTNTFSPSSPFAVTPSLTPTIEHRNEENNARSSE